MFSHLFTKPIACSLSRREFNRIPALQALSFFVILCQFIEDLSNSLEVLAFTPSLNVQAIAQAEGYQVVWTTF